MIRDPHKLWISPCITPVLFLYEKWRVFLSLDIPTYPQLVDRLPKPETSYRTRRYHTFPQAMWPLIVLVVKRKIINYIYKET
ncbi:MAG: hypothetical protein PHP24_03595, partial [Acidithiobacillus sp.]|nr:hypothetical protein [Acidithiobacillus sp.]